MHKHGERVAQIGRKRLSEWLKKNELEKNWLINTQRCIDSLGKDLFVVCVACIHV